MVPARIRLRQDPWPNPTMNRPMATTTTAISTESRVSGTL